MKVSVIIAAYNAEKFLAETLDSTINQSMAPEDYEVVVVNDGSQDSTEEILIDYSKRVENIHFKTIENSGPSGARNEGLKMAKGDYVFFLDSDDIIDSEALEALYNRAVERGADLVIAKYNIFNNTRVFAVHNIDNLVQKDDIDCFDHYILWTFSCSNKLFRREVIVNNGIEFQPISYSEDGLFVMTFVFRCEKITGLDMVVLHYRRLTEESDSITATVSRSKINDYIKAHSLIYDEIVKAGLKRHGCKEEEELNSYRDYVIYVNEFYKKYVQILINQFYSHYGTLDSDTVDFIVEKINETAKKMSLSTYCWLQNAHPDILLRDIHTPEKKREGAVMCCALFFDGEGEEAFLYALDTANAQTLADSLICVPERARAIIEKSENSYPNLVYIDCNEKTDFFKKCFKEMNAQYITFNDGKYYYAPNAFLSAFKALYYSTLDFCSDVVYQNECYAAQPIFVSSYVKQRLDKGIESCSELCFEDILPNKFFKAESFTENEFDGVFESPESVYDKKYGNMNDMSIVFYYNRPDEFFNELDTKRALALKNKIYTPDDINSISLSDAQYSNKSGVQINKLININPETETNEENLFIKKCIEKYKDKKVENKTVFFSIRDDGKLTGNALALEKHVKGKKQIIAKRLPHDEGDMDSMMRALMTAKVIVTDDYLKYLRYFPLKNEQRVIQLWHACGAFKKFGLRGTNLSPVVDKATHAQYNLVCVSGESVRDIYADTFDVPIEIVQALGCPETDVFFNSKLIKKTEKSIYRSYRQLKGKEVILYAPTFRDNGKRQIFTPHLDFEALSKALGPEQVLVICPHPVMENEIIDKKYDNILVIRDFTTKQLMLISSMLITDYSSVIFEYSLLNKPMAFYCYDYDSYNRSFYLDYPDDLPGPVLKTQDELVAFITSPQKETNAEKTRSFARKYMSGCDGNSTKRIAKIINQYMEKK